MQALERNGIREDVVMRLCSLAGRLIPVEKLRQKRHQMFVWKEGRH